jgi:hypothetical protein
MIQSEEQAGRTVLVPESKVHSGMGDSSGFPLTRGSTILVQGPIVQAVRPSAPRPVHRAGYHQESGRRSQRWRHLANRTSVE